MVNPAGEGEAQGGAEATAEDRPDDIAALLDLNGADLVTQAFADDVAPESEPEAELDDEDEDDSEEPADLDDEEEPEDDESEEESAEDDEEEPREQPNRPATAEAWGLELLKNPQRESEIPKAMRQQAIAVRDSVRDIVAAGMRFAVEQDRQKRAQAAQKTSKFQALYDAGDVEGLRDLKAEDPEGYRLFLQQELEAAPAMTAEQQSAQQAQFQTQAQVELAKLTAFPDAYQRVVARAQSEGWSATPEHFAALQQAVGEELAKASAARPPADSRARRTTEAARRRKSLPRVDVSGGRTSARGFDSEKELEKSGSQLAHEAFA